MIPHGYKYSTMDPEDWENVDYFKPEEFKHPDWLDKNLIFTLDQLRAYVGRPFFIHCDFEFRKNFSWHSHGFAIDGHFEGMHPYDQYEAACRFDEFNGVGFYLWWAHPGIHVDTRPNDKTQQDSRWFSPKKGLYLPVTAENLRGYLWNGQS